MVILRMEPRISNVIHGLMVLILIVWAIDRFEHLTFHRSVVMVMLVISTSTLNKLNVMGHHAKIPTETSFPIFNSCLFNSTVIPFPPHQTTNSPCIKLPFLFFCFFHMSIRLMLIKDDVTQSCCVHIACAAIMCVASAIRTPLSCQSFSLSSSLYISFPFTPTP